MKLKKSIFAVLAGILVVLGLVLVPTASYAAGSDGPTPYSVTQEGIFLPDGDVFTDASHVNIRDINNNPYNIHFEKKYADPSHAEWKNRPFDHADPRNQFYGKSFIPWEALKNGNTGFNAKSNFCIKWVQVKTDKGYNEHFGEGGQDPVGPGCENPNPPKTEYSSWTQLAFTCDTKEGDVLPRTRTVTVTTYYFNGKVKDVQTTTEREDYVVTKTDVTYPTSDGRDCRTEVPVVVPTMKGAIATCVAGEPTYKEALLTVPSVTNGTWKINDSIVTENTFSLPRDSVTTLTFTVTDGNLFRVGDAPTPGQGDFWTATKTGNSIVFTVKPNSVQDVLDCELANSGLNGGSILWIAGGAVALLVTGFLLLRRQRVA